MKFFESVEQAVATLHHQRTFILWHHITARVNDFMCGRDRNEMKNLRNRNLTKENLANQESYYVLLYRFQLYLNEFLIFPPSCFWLHDIYIDYLDTIWTHWNKQTVHFIVYLAQYSTTISPLLLPFVFTSRIKITQTALCSNVFN